MWVNSWLQRDLRTPFGGMKNSGVGREGGLEALRFFTEAQNVCVKLLTIVWPHRTSISYAESV